MAKKNNYFSYIKNIIHEGSDGPLNPAQTYRQLCFSVLLVGTERKRSLLGIICLNLKTGSRRTGRCFSLAVHKIQVAEDENH